MGRIVRIDQNMITYRGGEVSNVRQRGKGALENSIDAGHTDSPSRSKTRRRLISNDNGEGMPPTIWRRLRIPPTSKIKDTAT
jgi:hypothetical protein